MRPIRTVRETAPLPVYPLAISAALLLASCTERSSEIRPRLTGHAVAVVEDQLITLEEFQTELARRMSQTPGQYTTAAQGQELLDQMIRTAAVYAKAKAAGYDRDSELMARFKSMVMEKYEQDQLSKNAGDGPSISSEAERHYQTHIEKFTRPEKCRVAMIFIKVPAKATAEKKQEWRQKAAAILAEAKEQTSSERSFGALAQRYSEDQASRYVGGDCGWIARKQSDYRWDPKVIEAAFSLSEPGQLSPPIETTEGLYLIKLIERKPAEARPLAEVREAIEYHLARAREERLRREFYQRQKEGLRIEINHALLASLQWNEPSLAENQTPPRLPAP